MTVRVANPLDGYVVERRRPTALRRLAVGSVGYDMWMRTRTDLPSQHSAVSRFFRNPETGEVVVAQLPNIPLWIFLAATVTRLLFHPAGTLGTIVSVVGTIGLVVWAVLEIIRGESPFRRVLGAVVLIALVVGWVIQ